MPYSKSVEEYISSRPGWEKELFLLRDTVLSTQLEETVKWGTPVYTAHGKNVVGLAAFKEYVAIWFFQGALLKDEKGKLVNAQEGKTKALRQWRFASCKAVENEQKNIRAYVEEAIANARAGKEIKPQRSKSLILPKELAAFLGKNPHVMESFVKLSAGKQREFAGYISEAKRSETREKRLEIIAALILEEIGLNDKYRK